MATRRRLTARQQKFIEGKLEGKSSAAAARAAGYAESVARNADHLISRSPAVQAAICDLLESSGVKLELLAQRVSEGLDAVEVRFFNIAGKNVISRESVDFAERRKMVELCLRLRGLDRPPTKIEHEVSLEDFIAESYEPIPREI
jgi:hypothetical protein